MIRLCYLFVLPIVVLAFLFPEPVLRIYTDNTELIAASVASLRVMLTSFIICGPAIIYRKRRSDGRAGDAQGGESAFAENQHVVEVSARRC